MPDAFPDSSATETTAQDGSIPDTGHVEDDTFVGLDTSENSPSDVAGVPDAVPADVAETTDAAPTDLADAPDFEDTAQSCHQEGFVTFEQEFSTYQVPNDQWWALGLTDQKRSFVTVWFYGDATATYRAPGRYPLSLRRDCTECGFAFFDCTEDGETCQSYFVATEGTLVITRWDNEAHRAEGHLESMVFSEVVVNETGDAHDLVPSGKRWCVDRVDIGATLAATRVGWSLTGDTTTTGRGGPAGELNSTSACPAGFIGEGLTGTAFEHPALQYWYLTSFAIRCRELMPEGMGASISDGDAVVEGGGGTFTESACAPGSVLVGLRYGLNSDPRVEGLAALCAPFETWMDPQVFASTSRARVIGQVDATELTCPRGYALTAVNARTDPTGGNGIYSVQGTCSRVAR